MQSLLWYTSLFIYTKWSKWADDYFSRLNQIHNPLRISHNNVGIAMIDTGINAHHPEMAKHIQNGSITLWKEFLNELNPLEDKCGHETHRASVLLKTASNAELLVARVFDDNERMSYRDKYLSVVDVMLTFYREFLFSRNPLGYGQLRRHYFNFMRLLLWGCCCYKRRTARGSWTRQRNNYGGNYGIQF